MTGKQLQRLTIQALLAILFVWLIVRQINLHDLKEAFIGTTAVWAIVGLFAFAVDYACRIERWRLMLNRDNPRLEWRHCAGPFLGSFAANNVLPFRAGDVLRAFAFNERLAVSSGIVLATLFVERLLDLLMVLVILSAALFLFDLNVSGFAGVGFATLVAIAIGILVLLFYPGLFAPLAFATGRLAVRMAPGLGQKLFNEINKSMDTLAHLAKGHTMIKLVMWSLAAWLAEGCVFWFAAIALPSIATPNAAWLALPVGTLATLIPSTPGYVGTFDYFTVRSMSALSNNPSASTAYALLVHALLWFPPTVIGGIYHNALVTMTDETQITVVGAGFTGLAVAYELVKTGITVTILEEEAEIGGLAAAFDVGGEKLDRFYHHWFTNDLHVMNLIEELGLQDRIEINPTNTGVYYANNFFKLSTPWDLLNFTPLSVVDRVRLGLLALRARRVKDWMSLEAMTAHEWLKQLGGENVYRVVWEPLLKGKFGPYAEQVSAVWFWNKLKLRGGSRGKGGEERLAYFKGGFIALANAMANKICELGGEIVTNASVSAIEPSGGGWKTTYSMGMVKSDRVVVTTALPLIANMVRSWADPRYVISLERIQYIGNVCLVLELDRPLSKTYWLNVNDPSFPFVGVIEHTNFERTATYGGSHIVYLSKYLPHTDALYSMSADELLDYSLPYLQKMFPKLERNWIQHHHLWRARWSQPVVEKHYSRLIPTENGPKDGLYICSMAQIYPEDRGTNYAIRAGRSVGLRLAEATLSGKRSSKP